jgi:uncharacterized protein (TIGR01777 family)
MKKIVIAGGTGFLGHCLSERYSKDDVVILTRGKARTGNDIRYVNWDGKTIGPWKESLEGADVLINLNGKSVDCRYTRENKALIYSTRLDATAILGRAIQQCKLTPKLWINASSATIYRHSLDREMTEAGEPGSGFSVDVCQRWEATFNQFDTPETRKVIIRTAIVLGRSGGALRPLRRLATAGLGGRQGAGNQYVSWLHEHDFVGIIDFIITHDTASGLYNLAAPAPVPNKHFMRALRSAVGMPVGIVMPAWLLKIGAALIRTEPELILKSRRVIPARLLANGYQFRFDKIENALDDLCKHAA